MLKILNREAATKMAESLIESGELKTYDQFMSVADGAAQRGFFIRINKEYYALTKTQERNVTWFMDCIIEFSEQFMKSANLQYKYKYMEHAINFPKGYCGEKERAGFFNFSEGKVRIKKIEDTEKSEKEEELTIETRKPRTQNKSSVKNKDKDVAEEKEDPKNGTGSGKEYSDGSKTRRTTKEKDNTDRDFAENNSGADREKTKKDSVKTEDSQHKGSSATKPANKKNTGNATKQKAVAKDAEMSDTDKVKKQTKTKATKKQSAEQADDQDNKTAKGGKVSVSGQTVAKNATVRNKDVAKNATTGTETSTGRDNVPKKHIKSKPTVEEVAAELERRQKKNNKEEKS